MTNKNSTGEFTGELFSDDSARNSRLVCYIDGACLGNPGPAGVGVVIFGGKGEELARISKHLGYATNNIAEYTALIEALKHARKLGAKILEVRSDSQLLIRQMRGEYKIKHPNIVPLAEEVRRLLGNFERVEFIHVPREQNKLADHLAKAAAKGGQ